MSQEVKKSDASAGRDNGGYPTLDIAVHAALALSRNVGDVPVARREYSGGEETGRMRLK